MKLKYALLIILVLNMYTFVLSRDNIYNIYVNCRHKIVNDTLKYKHIMPAPINTRIAAYEFIPPFIGVLDMPEKEGQIKKQLRIINLDLSNEIKWDEIEIEEGFKHKSLITLGADSESFYILSGGMIVYRLNSRGIIEKEIVLEKRSDFSWMINSKLVIGKDKLFIIMKSENCRNNNTEGINCLRLVIYDLSGKIIKFMPIDNENEKSRDLAMFGNEVKIKIYKNSLLVFNSITNILLDYNLINETVSYRKLNELEEVKAKNIKDIIIQTGIIKILSSDPNGNLYLINYDITKDTTNIIEANLKNIYWASLEKKLCLRINKTGMDQELELFSLLLQ